VHCRKLLFMKERKREQYIVRYMTLVRIWNEGEKGIRFSLNIKRVSVKEKLL
jgi:hypothetical protein